MAVTAPMHVEPPTVVPYRFGLLSVADVIDDGTSHWQSGVEYEPYTCGDSSAFGYVCGTPGTGGDPYPPYTPEKDFTDGVPLVQGEPFNVYAGYTCRTVGRSLTDAAERARRSLTFSEGRTVEEWFIEWLFSDANEAGVENLTPSDGAVCPVGGLGMLEQYAAENYGAVPTIHMSRQLATILYSENAVVSSGGMLRTGLDSKVAAEGGYAGRRGPTVAPDGEQWMVATGQVVARRSDIFTTPPDGDLGGMVDRATNSVYVLAERTYVVTYECFAAAVRVAVSCA